MPSANNVKPAARSARSRTRSPRLAPNRRPSCAASSAWLPIRTIAHASGRWRSPALKPIASSSRLMLTPSASRARPCARETRRGVDFVALRTENQEHPDREKCRAGHIIPSRSHNSTKGLADGDAHERHSRLETGQQQAHPPPPRGRKPRNAERRCNRKRVQRERQQQRNQLQHGATLASLLARNRPYRGGRGYPTALVRARALGRVGTDASSSKRDAFPAASILPARRPAYR